MKRIVTFLICIFVGVGIGWYFGYTRQLAKNQRELLRQYHAMRDHFGLTDADMAELGKQLPYMRADMERSDEYAAAIALAVSGDLVRSNFDGARMHLAQVVDIYYRQYRFGGGNSNLIAKIEKAAATNSAIATQLSKKIE